MIAWRGASRYIDPAFLPAFDMECEALRFVRQQIGLDNLQLMIPFCRSPEEGREVAQVTVPFTLAPLGAASRDLELTAPETPGAYLLKATATSARGGSTVSRRKVAIAEAESFRERR